MSNPLTHFNEEGRARMVDVTEKDSTQRMATATGRVYMQPETLRLITDGQIKKGDVLAVEQVAGWERLIREEGEGESPQAGTPCGGALGPRGGAGPRGPALQGGAARRAHRHRGRA